MAIIIAILSSLGKMNCVLGKIERHSKILAQNKNALNLLVMKKYLLVVFHLLFAYIIFSQDYTKTVAVEKEYVISEVVGVGGGGGGICYHYYHIACDTLIGDLIYYKVESENFEEARGYVREDTLEQKVYFWPKDSISERLVVDYQLKVGDRFDFDGWGYSPKVDSITNYNGIKKIWFEFVAQVIFVEGRGNSKTGIIPHRFINSSASINDTLNICNPTSIVENVKIELDFEIYPNPTYGSVNLTSKTKEIRALLGLSSYSIIDVHGIIRAEGNLNGSAQIDLHHLVNGIYFLKLESDTKFITKKILKLD